MFILKGQDFSMKVNTLHFNYFNEDCFESELIKGDFDGCDRLIDLDTLADYSDLNLYINDKDFSFEFKYDNDNIIIEATKLIKEDILNDSLFDDEELETINNNDNTDLPVRCKSINFTEFKNMFDLKGTKKAFINNCPEGFQLSEYKNYVLSKEIRNGNEIFCYECILGSVK